MPVRARLFQQDDAIDKEDGDYLGLNGRQRASDLAPTHTWCRPRLSVGFPVHPLELPSVVLVDIEIFLTDLIY